MTTQQIETKVNELATKVLPAEWLESFMALPLDSKLVGIATFAHAGGDERMRDNALEQLKLWRAR